MKGTIEGIRFLTDRKKQRYAVASIGGEEIYTWDKDMVGYLETLQTGSEVEYGLMEKEGKFKKFRSISSDKPDGETQGLPEPPGGWDWDSVRILSLTDIKTRTKALDLAKMDAGGADLSPEEEADRTMKIADKYVEYMERGYGNVFRSVREYIRKAFG